MQIRLRFEKGQSTITKLFTNSPFIELIEEINKLTGIPKEKIIIKYDYPPKLLTFPEDITINLEKLEIFTGSLLFIEESPTNINQLVNNNKKQEKQPEWKQKIDQIPCEQIPNKEGTIMYRKIIESDNSCLFQAIRFCLQLKNTVTTIREIIQDSILKNKQIYNITVLQKTPEDYASCWGGEIEMQILSNHFKVEICAINIETVTNVIYGESNNYAKRIYLLYSGIHFDALFRNIAEDMDIKYGQTFFNPLDEYAFQGSLVIANELRKKKEYTNLYQFVIQCGVCQEKFKGQAQAVEHSKLTGHMNFSEVNQ